jgi:hypothetical protein
MKTDNRVQGVGLVVLGVAVATVATLGPLVLGAILLGAYTLIGASVAGMAITMGVRHDPDASVVTIVGSTLAAASLAAVTGYFFRPLFARGPSPVR